MVGKRFSFWLKAEVKPFVLSSRISAKSEAFFFGARGRKQCVLNSKLYQGQRTFFSSSSNFNFPQTKIKEERERWCSLCEFIHSKPYFGWFFISLFFWDFLGFGHPKFLQNHMQLSILVIETNAEIIKTTKQFQMDIYAQGVSSIDL